MDIHQRAVGVLHLVHGVLVAFVLLMLCLFFGALLSMASLDTSLMRFFGSFGALIFAPFLLLALGQMVAAIFLLQGSRAARPWIIVFGVLGLFNFPIGTAIGIYTLWALLREQGDANLIRG
jgi:hypothetical protein